MKVLGVFNTSRTGQMSPVDRWRVKLPLDQLKQHTDWQIDYRFGFVEFENGYSESQLQENYDHLKQYDIIFSSYYTNASVFSFLKMLSDKEGVKLIVDVDDDLWDIDETNPYTIFVDEKNRWQSRVMLEHVTKITTTNDYLSGKLHHKTKTEVAVLPNMIHRGLHEHTREPHEGIRIGYFGGASHYRDLHETGFYPALERVMHEHKNVTFTHVGGTVNAKNFTKAPIIPANLPSKRHIKHKGARGEEWYDLYKTLQFDIACGPLLDMEFNRSKSDIKWQEATVMGAAFIASRYGPYARRIRHRFNGLAVNNTKDAWYEGLKQLITDTELRQKCVDAAQSEVKYLEDNWQVYKDFFEGMK